MLVAFCKEILQILAMLKYESCEVTECDRNRLPVHWQQDCDKAPGSGPEIGVRTAGGNSQGDLSDLRLCC